MTKHGDDELALKKAVEAGLDLTQLSRIEFIVDVLDRNDKAAAMSRLSQASYDCDLWDDPVDGSLSIYAARMLYPSLELILEEKEKIRRILVGLAVAVEDWGTELLPISWTPS